MTLFTQQRNLPRMSLYDRSQYLVKRHSPSTLKHFFKENLHRLENFLHSSKADSSASFFLIMFYLEKYAIYATTFASFATQIDPRIILAFLLKLFNLLLIFTPLKHFARDEFVPRFTLDTSLTKIMLKFINNFYDLWDP